MVGSTTSERARLKGVTDVIKCESCGWENPLHAAFCTNCGSELDRADMSLSTDMSGSDDLSLDGSESNLIVEAAKASSKNQRLAKPENQASPETLSAPVQSGADGIDNRATLQLTPTGAETLVEQADVPEADEKSEQSVGVEEAQDLLVDEVGESEVEIRRGEEQQALLSMQPNDAPSSDGDDDLEDVSAREEPSEDNFAYVAFDDGLPEEGEDSLEDSSMRSLDVGVESLSMDDSLLLDGKQAKNMERGRTRTTAVKTLKPTSSQTYPRRVILFAIVVVTRTHWVSN